MTDLTSFPDFKQRRGRKPKFVNKMPLVFSCDEVNPGYGIIHIFMQNKRVTPTALKVDLFSHIHVKCTKLFHEKKQKYER